MGISLKNATLAQIAGELRRRANRQRARFTGTTTKGSLVNTIYHFGHPARLDKIAKQLQEMDQANHF